MKNVIKTLIALSVLSTVSVNATAAATFTGTETDNTSFTVSGTIESECKVTSALATGADELDLASSSFQDAASVNIWCNTGTNATTSTTYSSTNGGVLKDAVSGVEIAYQLDLGAGGVSLTSDQVVNQAAGSGDTGTAVSTDITIKTLASALQQSGTYTDTITVTVAAN